MFLLARTHTRYTATALHFFASLSVFALLLGTALLFWYPTPYFSASGGWQGIRLVAAVDLVLGPLLTLVLYDPKKSRRELLMDIGVVVLIQSGALLWGIKAVYEQRPVAVVFLDTSFYTVPAVALQSQGVDLQQLDAFGLQRPVVVFADRPNSGPGVQEYLRLAEVEQIPPHEQFGLYAPLSEHFSRVIRSAVDAQEIMANNADMKLQIERVLEQEASEITEYYFLPLTSRYRNIVLMFDHQGALIAMVSAPFKSGNV